MTADYDVGKFQEFIFAYNSPPFFRLFSSRPSPSSWNNINLVWNNINSDPIKAPDAPQTFLPRNALQGRGTWSAPKFGFFFKSSCLREASDRLCFLLP